MHFISLDGENLPPVGPECWFLAPVGTQRRDAGPLFRGEWQLSSYFPLHMWEVALLWKQLHSLSFAPVEGIAAPRRNNTRSLVCLKLVSVFVFARMRLIEGG